MSVKKSLRLVSQVRWTAKTFFTFDDKTVEYIFFSHTYIASLTGSMTNERLCLFTGRETIKLPIQLKMDPLPAQLIIDSLRYSELILR